MFCFSTKLNACFWINILETVVMYDYTFQVTLKPIYRQNMIWPLHSKVEAVNVNLEERGLRKQMIGEVMHTSPKTSRFYWKIEL